MKIHEYQGKELFRKYGVPVPFGIAATTAEEAIAAIPKVQIVCNSELDAADVAVSKHVRETALKERWNEAPSEVEALLHRDRYRRLH